MSYSAIRPGTPCERRYFYRQGFGFVISISLAALLLGVSSLI